MAEQEQILEFQGLQASALERLREGAHSVLLAVMPSFTDCRTLSVTSGRTPVATWRVWRRLVDSEKFRSPVERLRHPRILQPTIESGSVAVSVQTREQCLTALASIQIPALPPLGQWGLDGTSYETRVSHGYQSSSYVWWHTYPAEWTPLRSWFAQWWETLAVASSAEPGFLPAPFGE